MKYNGPRPGDQREEKNRDRLQIPVKPLTSYNFPRCIGYRCKECNQIKKDCDEIKKLIVEKLDVQRVNEVTTEAPPAAAINLCNQDVIMGEEMRIN